MTTEITIEKNSFIELQANLAKVSSCNTKKLTVNVKSFIKPYSILPLCSLAHVKGITLNLSNDCPESCKSYLEAMCFPNGIAPSKLSNYHGKLSAHNKIIN